MDQEQVEGAIDGTTDGSKEVEGAMDQEVAERAMAGTNDGSKEVEGAMGGTNDGSGRSRRSDGS